MQDLQQIFNRLQEAKKKKKDLESAYKDALSTSLEHKELTDQLKTMREKKKSIEGAIKDQFANELTQIDDLKIDIASDMELISDIAMTTLMKGDSIDIKDQYDNEYEPIVKVTFKKAT